MVYRPSAVVLARMNPHHDAKGKFAPSSGSGGMSAAEFAARVASAATGDEAVDMARATPTDRGQRSAIDSYAGGAYDRVNGGLRSGAGNIEGLAAYDQELVGRLDTIMADQGGLSGDIVVRRGLASGRRTFGGREPAVGMEWTDHGYTSTTTSGRAERTFTGESGVEMRILVPKGTRAFSNDHLDPDEVVLDRGLSFRVVRDNGRDPYYGTRQLDVQIIGPGNG